MAGNPRTRQEVSNIRVEVTVRQPWVAYLTDKEEIAKAEEIAEAIRRAAKADFLGDVGSVNATHEVETVCIHCSTKWAPDTDDRNWCCAKEEEEHAKLFPAPALSA